VKLPDARAEERADLTPARGDQHPGGGQADPHPELPRRTGDASREAELEHRDRPSRPDDACQLTEGRQRVSHVAEQVREREPVERTVVERQPLGLALDELDPVAQGGGLDAPPSLGEHLPALVEPDDAATRAARELDRHGSRPGCHVQHPVDRSDVHPGDEEAAPARILSEGEEGRVPVVGWPERGEEVESLILHEVYFPRVTLAEDLQRIAASAGRFASGEEELAGVLAAEPAQGGRIYLCAYRSGEDVSWLALDDSGEPVTDRERVREAASLVALSELAEESAGGGELDELRSRLVALRLTENPDGIEAAEEAVLHLQQTLGAPPRLATAGYLDDVGAATKRLEDALGTPGSSPFAEAMKASAGAVQSFTSDVESNYKESLR
jgi:hypothetical protein